jgi:hypothetical protein
MVFNWRDASVASCGTPDVPVTQSDTATDPLVGALNGVSGTLSFEQL